MLLSKIKNNNIIKIENTDPSQHLILTVNYDINSDEINPIRPDPIADVPDPVPDKKDDKKKPSSSGISSLLIFALFLILIAIGLAVAWKLMKLKQNNEKYKKTVEQLSLTLSGKEVENPQKQPLINEENNLLFS